MHVLQFLRRSSHTPSELKSRHGFYSLVALREENVDLCRLCLGFTLAVAVSEFQANFIFQHSLVRKAKLQEKDWEMFQDEKK